MGNHLPIIMRIIYYILGFLLPRSHSGAIAKYLVKEKIRNDLLDSTPTSSFASYHETHVHEVRDDMSLFIPSTGAIDSPIFPTEWSDLDDPCPMEFGPQDDEEDLLEWSDPETLWVRGLDDEDLSLLAENNDQQCRWRRRTKPKQPEEALPSEPNLWPLVYPEIPTGRCPDPMRPIASCCAGRDGTQPFDCWHCGSGFVNFTLQESNLP